MASCNLGWRSDSGVHARWCSVGMGAARARDGVGRAVRCARRAPGPQDVEAVLLSLEGSEMSLGLKLFPSSSTENRVFC
ncbi:unnamed protein product [Musa acuminata subsp. burmannicoides]